MARLRLPVLGFLLTIYLFLPKAAFAIACGREIVSQFMTNLNSLCASYGTAYAACITPCSTSCNQAMWKAVTTCEKGDAVAAGALVQMLSGAAAAPTGMAGAAAPVASGTTTVGGASGVHTGASAEAKGAVAACSGCPVHVHKPFTDGLVAAISSNAAQGAGTTAQASTMSKALGFLKSPLVIGAAALGLGYFLGSKSGGEEGGENTDPEPTETPAIPEPPAVAEAPATSSAASSVASTATVVQASETITNPGVQLSPLGGDNDSGSDTVASVTAAQATPFQQDFDSTSSTGDEEIFGDDDATTLGAGGGSDNTALASGGDDSASNGRALAAANGNDAAGAKPATGAGGAAGAGFSFDSGGGASAAATGSGGQMLMGTPGRKLASGSSSSRSARRNLAMVVNTLARSISLTPANSANANAAPVLTPAQERSRLLNTMQSRGLIRRPASTK